MSRNFSESMILPLPWYMGPYDFTSLPSPTLTKPGVKLMGNARNQWEPYDS